MSAASAPSSSAPSAREPYVPSPLAPEGLVLPADLDELAPSVWPQNARRVDGVVEVAGLRVDELASRFGTPLYVVDEDDVRSRAARTRDAFTRAFEPLGVRVKVYYAAKAFLSIEIARWMDELGLALDVASGGEFAVGIAAGFPPARMGYHGNNKSDSEIADAVRARVGGYVIDSRMEVDRVAEEAARQGVVQKVRLRVNSGVHASTHDFLATSHEDQKFGVTLADVDSIVAAIRHHDSLEFLGLHCHIGSQIFETGGFSESARRLIEVHARLLKTGPVPDLNLGGGFGIAYTEADAPAAIETIAEEMADAVARECARWDIPVPAIAIEPGRSIVGPGGITLYSVGTIKDVDVVSGDTTATRRYVSVDGGMSDNARTALYGADYLVRLASRSSDAPAQLVRVAGKHCESGDIVVNHDYLPADVTSGDLLAVAATGAYCWSLSSNYNMLGRPPVVAVRNGEARVIVRGESIADLLRRDAAYQPAEQAGGAPSSTDRGIRSGSTDTGTELQ